jgi:hypothetical protein
MQLHLVNYVCYHCLPAPGNAFSLESAPFKMTAEYLEVGSNELC